MSFLSLLRRAACALALGLTASQAAVAQSQHDLVDPTAWWFIDDGSLQDLVNRANLGYRIVDIEVHGSNADRYSASFVRNTGAYQKAHWWYVGQTQSDVQNALSANNARLIDINPYQTSSGVRYATIMISNTGADAVASGWWTGLSQATMDQFIASNPTQRVISIEPYWNGSALRYAYIWVQNTGTFSSGWWYLRNTTSATIDNFLGQNGARLIDLERHPDGVNFSAVMLPADGNSTYHLYGLNSAQVLELSEQFASRVVDIERRQLFLNQSFDMVIRRNDNDLAIDANNRMRANIPLGATSGFVLDRIDAATPTVAGVKESSSFEPAGLMTQAHLLAALTRVFNGLQTLNTPITVNTGQSGSCPNGTAPVSRPLIEVLERMMGLGSTTDAWALQASYGVGYIQNLANSVGAGGIDINHILGCFCSSPRSGARLIDFAAINEAVATGFVGDFEEEFFDVMSQTQDFAPGSSNSGISMLQLLNASSLNTAQRNAFRALLYSASTFGEYTCSGGQEAHRSSGTYVRIPFKSGCNLEYREYFLGAWVNDATSNTAAGEAVGDGIDEMYRHVIAQAIASWENSSCNPFSTYCQANPNSTGALGVISGSGTAQYTSPAPLVISAASMPPQSFTYLVCGDETAFVQGPGGSAGNLCVGGAIGRFFSSIQQVASNGTATTNVALSLIPHPVLGTIALQTGDNYHFQWWHRDSGGAGLPSSNFTNALRVVVQ